MKTKISMSDLDWVESTVKGFYSKEFLDHNRNTLKLVKVAPASTYPEHRHPDKTEFAYVLEGEVHIRIQDQWYTGKSGDYFLFPQNQLHSIRSNGERDCLLLIGAIPEK
jgi:quercetin dioxygenase-like cupin family protein